MPTKKKPTRRVPQFRYEVNVYLGLNHEPVYSHTVSAQNRTQAECVVLCKMVEKMLAVATRIEKGIE